MRKKIKLYQNHLAYSIVDHQTGKLLASAFLNEPHEYLLKKVGISDTEKIVSVIAYETGHNMPRWEFRHDKDHYLRKQGIITESEWLRRMRITALCLIQNGAAPENEVLFDGNKNTLGGLAYGTSR